MASLYIEDDCPFELTDLRTLDTKLANACWDYLNYDRLGLCDLDRHSHDGGAEVAGWIRDYGLGIVIPSALRARRTASMLVDVTSIVERLKRRTRTVFANAHGSEFHA